jgi:hypothetical protein
VILGAATGSVTVETGAIIAVTGGGAQDGSSGGDGVIGIYGVVNVSNPPSQFQGCLTSPPRASRRLTSLLPVVAVELAVEPTGCKSQSQNPPPTLN